uniref:FBD-associated F-box protein n=1 Tax=Noccaea caerulescens TaxID=107243 RepID=A0A1J3IE38_NOCCA
MVFLPSLKTLHLKDVKYSSEESIRRLLSNSPLLEDLLVDLRKRHSMGKLTFVVPSLQIFSLYIPGDCDIDGVVIETPSLKYFKLLDDNRESHYYLIETMPNLIAAYLDVKLPDIKSVIASITFVKRIAICSEVVSSTSLNIWSYVDARSIFRIYLSGYSKTLLPYKT